MDYNQYTDGYITYTQKKNKTLETRFSQSVCLYQSKYCKDTEDYAKKTDYTICERKLVHLSSLSAKDFFPCQLNTFFSASQRRSPLTAKTFSTASQRLPPLPDKNVHLCQPKTFSSTNQRRSPLLAKDFFHCQPKTTFFSASQKLSSLPAKDVLLCQPKTFSSASERLYFNTTRIFV